MSGARNTIVLALVLAVGAAALATLGWRRHIRNRPPPPTAQAISLAATMTGAYFQPEGSSFRLPYRLHVPAKLEAQRLYPLIVYLHSAGFNGSENLRQLGQNVAELIDLASNVDSAFVLVPQAPWGVNWVTIKGPPFLNYSEQQLAETDAIVATRSLVAQLPSRYPIDPDRMYVIGFSAGAAGTWELLTRADSQPFAAAALLSGAYDPSRAPSVAGMPLWFFHGAEDPMSPYSTTLTTVEALRRAGGAPRYTLYQDVAHDTNASARKDGVYQWLLQQRRSAWSSRVAIGAGPAGGQIR